MPPPMVAAPAPAEVAERAQPGITNTQEADVDEGGIVKVHGDHIVILRRGRLFTVATGDRAMRPVDRIDAFPRESDAAGAWYDEMLIAGDRVVVVGCSYKRGGTEINRFRISGDGRLWFEDSHQLRSNDYYSADSYASRLIGNRLIFYSSRSILTISSSGGMSASAALSSGAVALVPGSARAFFRSSTIRTTASVVKVMSSVLAGVAVGIL